MTTSNTQPARKPHSVARIWREICGYLLGFWLAFGLILNYLFF